MALVLLANDVPECGRGDEQTSCGTGTPLAAAMYALQAFASQTFKPGMPVAPPMPVAPQITPRMRVKLDSTIKTFRKGSTVYNERERYYKQVQSFELALQHWKVMQRVYERAHVEWCKGGVTILQGGHSECSADAARVSVYTLVH